MALLKLSTPRLGRLAAGVDEKPQDWRFQILGLQPTTDQEFIERAYWYQTRRYSAMAQTEPEALKRIELVKAAYFSLCPGSVEPWTTRAGNSRASLAERRREHPLDYVLSLTLLMLLLGAAILAVNDAARMQADVILRQLALLLQQRL